MLRFIKNAHINRKIKGFSLIELMITITIISVLFIVLISRFAHTDVRAKETGVKNDFRAYSIACEQVLIENSGVDGFNSMTRLTSAINKYLDDDLKLDITGTSNAVDPWKHEYRLTLENVNSPDGELIITCAGANVLIDGIDDYYLSVMYSAGDISIYSDGFSLDISDRTIISEAVENDNIFTWSGTTVTGFKDWVTDAQKNIYNNSGVLYKYRCRCI